VSARITLRYFDCRSRGQGLRFALVDAGCDFDDVRIPTADLARFRRDAGRPELGGPFASLPVLVWDGHEVAQTLAIAGYLADKLGRETTSTAEERSRLAMITSAAHLDMQVPYSQLLWLPADCTDAKLSNVARDLLSQLTGKLGQLEALHRRRGVGGPFFGGAEPAVADCFVYESLSRGRDVFGTDFTLRLEQSPGLGALVSAMEARAAIAAHLGRGGVPYQVSASPSEPYLRQRLSALLA
jgi:glutathione S-transferase